MSVATWLGRRLDRRPLDVDPAADALLDRVERLDLVARWRLGMLETGFGRSIISAGTVERGALPRVVRVTPGRFGSTPVLTVYRPPGVTTADLHDERTAIADALGVWGVQMSDAADGHTRVELLADDPLAATIRYPLAGPADHLVFGLDEVGDVVSVPFDGLPNIAVQGSNGGGKSGQAYSILAQFAERARTHGDVEVLGIDPTSVLLGPWGEHPEGLRVLGTGPTAPARYTDCLRRIADGMDHRITNLPPRCDRLTMSPATPLRLVVVEELPGVSRRTGYKSSGAPSETQTHLARIASEGRKGLVRLLVIGQRLGSDVLATDTRDQLLARMTYGTRDLATIRMLTPEAGPDDLAALAELLPGVAIADMPGRPMGRMRSPWVGSYAQYCDLIAGTGPRAVEDVEAFGWEDDAAA